MCNRENYNMKIAIGSDHRGNDLRQCINDGLVSEGYEIEDCSSQNARSIDYPDVAKTVAEKVSSGTVDKGILICGTGIGMCIVANKFPNIRAVPCANEVIAVMSRKHNDANILCLSGDMLGERTCLSLVKKWLETAFDGGRHQGRLDKIVEIEQNVESEQLLLT